MLQFACHFYRLSRTGEFNRIIELALEIGAGQNLSQVTMDQTAAEFVELLNSLKGLPCSGVGGGVGWGSMIRLLFGETFLRPTKHFDGQTSSEPDARLCLGAEHAAWRIMTRQEVICASESDNRVGGPIDKGLQLLPGTVVEEVRVCPITFDLRLDFSGGINLAIFCQNFLSTGDHDNYHLRVDETFYVVTDRLSVKRCS